MSDTSQGPGWWLASDGKWYPPEQWTGPPTTSPPPTSAPTFVPTQSSTQAYPQTQPGQVPIYPSMPGPGAGPSVPPGYGYKASGYGPPATAPGGSTNGLAIAGFVCSLIGLFFITFIVGIVLGFVARSQIRKSGGLQRGDGLAIAAIIIGFAWAAFFIVTIAVGAGHHNDNSDVVSWTALVTSWA